MGIVDRMKNIMITPKTEWDVIAAEPTPPKQVIVGYVLPLVVLAAIATFVGMALVGTSSFLGGTYRIPMMWGLVLLVYQVLAGLIGVLVLAFIVDALAPAFGGQKDFRQAIKLVAYSYTSAAVGSVLGIIPWLGTLLAVAVGLYCIYLVYLGLPRLMKNPGEKSVADTVVIFVAAIVAFLIIGFISTLLMAPAMYGAARMGAQGERQDDKRREVTRKEGNRLGHEEVSKTGGRNVVSAEGKDVDIGTLKSAVGSLDLAELEAIK